LTEPRTHHAGNKRPNKSRQCTAYVAKRTERHDSAVEGEHERDQWSRDKIRAEFAGHLLYPPFVSPVQLPANCAFQPPLTQIEKHPRGFPFSPDIPTAGR